MNIPLACLAATLFFVVMVMMSIDNHIGTRIFAACCLVGPVWLGAIIAGCVVSGNPVSHPALRWSCCWVAVKFSAAGTEVLNAWEVLGSRRRHQGPSP